MKRRTLLTGAAVVAALGLALTGCSSNSSGSGGASSPGGGAVNATGQTLEVWIMQGTNASADSFFSSVSSAFQAQTGATLKIDYVAWGDAHDRFTTAMAGGTTPDVAEVGTTWTPEFANAGALVPLDSYIQADNLGGDLVQGLVDAGQLDGKQYGMPWYAGVRSLVYNTDMFNALGLKPPASWADIQADAAAIKAAYPDKVAVAVPGAAELTVYPWIWGAGGQVATQDSSGTWTSGLDSAQSIAGLTFWTGLAAAGYSSASATTWSEADVLTNFSAGDIGMAIMGSWTPASIVQKNPAMQGHFAATPIPGQNGGMSPSVLGGSHLAMFETAKNKDLAWAFIKMMTTGQYAQEWAQQTGYFPGQKALLQSQLNSTDPLEAPFVQQFVNGGAAVPVSANWGAVQAKKTTVTMMQSILSGKQSVTEAAQAAAADMTSTLNTGS